VQPQFGLGLLACLFLGLQAGCLFGGTLLFQLALLLGFAQRNRGMTRVLIGDALVNENERLQARINLLHDKIEAAIKQALRVAATQEQLAADADFGALADALLCYVVGRWHQYAKSGFAREPMAQWKQQWPMLYVTCLSQRSE